MQFLDSIKSFWNWMKLNLSLMNHLLEQLQEKQWRKKPVRELFSGCTEIGGVHGCEIIENCVDRPNRYDLMIVISMDADALTAWDESGIHKKWKKEYGESIEKKAIFDCE